MAQLSQVGRTRKEERQTWSLKPELSYTGPMYQKPPKYFDGLHQAQSCALTTDNQKAGYCRHPAFILCLPSALYLLGTRKAVVGIETHMWRRWTGPGSFLEVASKLSIDWEASELQRRRNSGPVLAKGMRLKGD